MRPQGKASRLGRYAKLLPVNVVSGEESARLGLKSTRFKEVIWLRSVESDYQTKVEFIDKICRELGSLSDHTIVVMGMISDGMWCLLPIGWQIAENLNVRLRNDAPPLDLSRIKQPIAMSVSVAQSYIKRLKAKNGNHL